MSATDCRAAPATPDDPADGEADRAIAERAAGGDTAAFAALYRANVADVHRYIGFHVRDPTLAEDLTSEVFVRALRSIGSYRWQGRETGAWLITIARNLIIDHRKSAPARREVKVDTTPEAGEPTPGPEHLAVASVVHGALRAAMCELSPAQQQCLRLRFDAGASLAETAEAMGANVNAVKALQHRATRALAARLAEYRH